MVVANKDIVYLVNAGNDPVQAAIANDYSFPASGILALGTWLRHRVPDLEVICRDGQVHSMEKIEQDIAKNRPGIVGISTLFTSYHNALKIAEIARTNGARVVLGNDQASQNSRAILENQPNVDYVIGAEYGELPLELLVRNLRGEEIHLDRIPSLTSRNGQGDVVGFDWSKDKSKLSIVSPYSGYLQALHEAGIDPRKSGALDLFPILDRTLYPQEHWQAYLTNYKQRFAWLHQEPVTGVATMNRARGCSRKGDLVCKHCDIAGVLMGEVAMSSPKMFWEEVRAAHQQVKANSLYEACDSFSSFPGLIKGIAESKPSNLGFNPRLFVYAQARDLANHPERIQMLKDIGVFRVNMGLESMSDTTLKHMKGERDSVEQNYRALQLLKDAGIHVYGSFVFGSEKETPSTLRQTADRAIGLINEGYLADVEASPVLPLAGNYQGRILMENGLWYVDRDHLDWPINLDKISRTYVDNFSRVTHADCITTAREIRTAAKNKGVGQGSGASRAENWKSITNGG